MTGFEHYLKVGDLVTPHSPYTFCNDSIYLILKIIEEQYDIRETSARKARKALMSMAEMISLDGKYHKSVCYIYRDSLTEHYFDVVG